MLLVLSYLAPLTDKTYYTRLASLAVAIIAARAGTQIFCPLSAILFKWIVIGRYKAGTYQMYVYILPL